MKRVNIAIAGRINSGKSTLMNLIAQQEFSIVDSTPGTTADVKATIMEIHNFSPVKLFDTAGIDEEGELGAKKKEKSLSAVKRADLTLLVVANTNAQALSDDFATEKEIIQLCESRSKQIFIIANNIKTAGNKAQDWEKDAIADCDKQTGNKKGRISGEGPDIFHMIREKFPEIPFLSVDLSASISHEKVLNFIREKFEKNKPIAPLLPLLRENSVVFLNIPMDDSSPQGRLLRPQTMIEEYLLRRFISTFSYRMDLSRARSQDLEEKQAEKARFDEIVDFLSRDGKLQLLITDSQAMDIIYPWCKDKNIELTTFSIVMINHQSGGRLSLFVQGLRAFQSLKAGDKIMIAEGCNHDRKNEDIGTVQIPRHIDRIFGAGNIKIDHYFGRIFAKEANLEQYKLVIHCGGCMLDHQSMASRIDDLVHSGLSFTNYGLLLSYLQGPQALNRAIKIFGLSL